MKEPPVARCDESRDRGHPTALQSSLAGGGFLPSAILATWHGLECSVGVNAWNHAGSHPLVARDMNGTGRPAVHPKGRPANWLPGGL
jgi:hypothetical protein